MKSLPPKGLQEATRRIVECFGRGNYAQLEELAVVATRTYPDHGFFWKALGVAQLVQGKDAAQAPLEKAAVLLPNDGEVFANLGSFYQQQKRWPESRDCFERALRLLPNNPVFHTNYGNLLMDMGDAAGALAAHERAIGLHPGFAQAHHNRAFALGRLPWNLDRTLDAYATALRIQPAFVPAWDGYLFALNYLPDVPANQMRAAAEQYGQMLRSRGEPISRHANRAETGRRLSIGFVSGDLREHVVGRALSAILPHLDRTAFRLVAYYTGRVEDTLSGQLKADFDDWRPIAMLDDGAVVAQIQGDGIDILVDLAGHTRNNRLPVFARKPAPVQISWLGYYATTGLREIDYFVGDPIVMPPEEAAHFVEQVWRLPEAYYCMPRPAKHEPSPLPARARGYVTFGCCNTLVKLSEPVLRCWAEILTALPTARLLLKTRELGTPAVRDTLLAHFATLGIGAHRLSLAGASSRDEYLEQLGAVDIALDPFPFPGGATTLDCLARGIPVVSKRGDRFIGHQGETLLRGIGLEDWIAADDQEYVRVAIAAATDLDALERQRARIGARLSTAPIFDGERLARQIGCAWCEMWQIWCRRQTAESV
jgi:protein O-GlcNAc transferase